MPKGEERMAVKTFDDDKYSTYFKFDKLAFFLYLCFALLLGILLNLIFKSSGLGFVIGLPMLVCLFGLER
jgi:hypothetical protein